MAGGTDIIVTLILVALGGAGFLLWMINAAEQLRLRERLTHQRALAELAYGDVPHLPRELAPARKIAGGGGGAKGQGPAEQATNRTHDGGGTTR